jgi:hypothetical protein
LGVLSICARDGVAKSNASRGRIRIIGSSLLRDSFRMSWMI